MIVGLFAAGAFLAATVSTAHAVVISDLYNTGVDGAGTPLGGGVDDPHYAIFAQPGAGSLVDSTVPVDGFPIPPWVANDANSRWIGPATADAVGPPGGYIYRTSFTLPVDVDLSTVLITGLWGTDDPGLDILINTASTSNTSSGFGSLTAFSITSGFVVGANTLDFVLHNSVGPTGLRVDDMTGGFELLDVPEPGTLVLFGLGLAALGLARRRRTVP